MRPDALCGLLAQEDRLMAFAAVVLGATSPGEVAAATGLPVRDVVRALHRLEQGGVVESTAGRLAVVGGVFKAAVREHGTGGAAAEPLDPDQAKAAVLRGFVRDGRLLSIPVSRGKRYIVLEYIAACFEPGVRYPERAVNAVLRAWHEDYAALRRHLIDEDLMARDDGMYWRSGGVVEITPT